MRFTNITAVAVAVLSSTCFAHPGHDHSHEVEERAAFMKSSKRDLSHCSAKMKARGIEARNVRRRAKAVEAARVKRGISTDAPHLTARDITSAAATSHLSGTTYSPLSQEIDIFSGNNSCILSPEVTEGPYYVSGEYIRRNHIEDQVGVPLTLDVQVIDMATCDPVVDTMVEIWHCNSTGVYSGVVASGNGDSSDATNIDKTFLRGLQPTQFDGVAQFTTLFPGHYTGRATHTHILAHFNGTINDNATYTGGYVSHVGQVFYDQDLITQVEATTPYSTNTQETTSNTEDTIATSEAADGLDPFVNYSLLGETIEEGVFAWISFGIDLTLEKDVNVAASYYAGGGIANANSNMGGGGEGGPGNGTMSGNMTGPPDMRA